MESTEVEWPHEHRRGNWFLYSKLGFEFTGQDPPSQDAVATWDGVGGCHMVLSLIGAFHEKKA